MGYGFLDIVRWFVASVVLVAISAYTMHFLQRLFDDARRIHFDPLWRVSRAFAHMPQDSMTSDGAVAFLADTGWVFGTGALLASVPLVWLGALAVRRIPWRAVHAIAFCVMGAAVGLGLLMLVSLWFVAEGPLSLIQTPAGLIYALMFAGTSTAGWIHAYITQHGGYPWWDEITDWATSWY